MRVVRGCFTGKIDGFQTAVDLDSLGQDPRPSLTDPVACSPVFLALTLRPFNLNSIQHMVDASVQKECMQIPNVALDGALERHRATLPSRLMASREELLARAWASAVAPSSLIQLAAERTPCHWHDDDDDDDDASTK